MNTKPLTPSDFTDMSFIAALVGHGTAQTAIAQETLANAKDEETRRDICFSLTHCGKDVNSDN